MIRTLLFCGAAACGLAACQDLGTVPEAGQPAAPALGQAAGAATPGAAPGTCQGRQVTPATVETVTEHVLLRPAEVAADGTLLAPPLYRTETRQRIVEERNEIRFETLCEADLTPEFVASLQRALAVRGLYRGPVTGNYDAATRMAVRGFQAARGLDSEILSLASARQLGLVAYPLPGAG